MQKYPNNLLNRETDTAVYFYTPAYYALDNFSAYTVRIWGKTFLTSEHAYQWKKFEKTNFSIAQKILAASSPDQAQRIAKLNKGKRRKDWSEIKLPIMEEILTAKLRQHSEVKDVLRSTGKRVIQENSKVDDFWGVGATGKGRNELGKLWMGLRTKFL